MYSVDPEGNSGEAPFGVSVFRRPDCGRRDGFFDDLASNEAEWAKEGEEAKRGRPGGE